MYSVRLRTRAEKDIEALPVSVARRVLDTIAGLGGNPRPLGIRKLEARNGYRIRQGDYRIVLEIDDDSRLVTIVRVKPHRDVYRDL
jgi:mRNA interferase RelE/StbE